MKSYITITLLQAKNKFIETIEPHYTANTIRTYDGALETFLDMLESRGIRVSEVPVTGFSDEYLENFIYFIQSRSPSTESLYLQVVKKFYEFLDSEQLAEINISRVRSIIKQNSRRSTRQSVDFPENEVDFLIKQITNLDNLKTQSDEDSENFQIRYLRDRALILALADTGLRVNEICKLRCGDID